MTDPIEMVTRRVKLDYTVTPGRAPSRFLRGLPEGRLLGQRCPRCEKVYAPPRGSCPACGVPTDEEVELDGKGTVTTFCVVNIPFTGQAVEIPYVCASVVLDGADLPLFTLIQEVPAHEVRMGMRVEAVWAPPEERGHTMESIRYFRPIDEPDAPFDSYKDAM